MTTQENNFPTVKQGSQSLVIMALAIVFKGLISGFTAEMNAALTSVLATLGGTHTVLTAGRFLIKSKWSGENPMEETEETVRTTRSKALPIVAPVTTDAKDMNVKLEGDINVTT